MNALLAIACSLHLADLLSGFWHWAEDRYFRTEWPILGPHIALPNEIHHSRPSEFLAGNYWHRNWTTIVPCVAAWAALMAAWPSWWWTCFLVASQGNEIHGWSHQRCGGVVSALQRTELLISPRHHAGHHREGVGRYCVMTGHLNPILDALGAWTLLERILLFVGVRTK